MPTDSEIYGYGTLANVLCCLCSLGGAFVLPCAKQHRQIYHVVLSIFMGLAVGTLASDALLHLVPEALGLHSHEEDEEEHMSNSTHHHDDEHDDEIHVEPFVWYCLVVLVGIYAFYILEVIMASLHEKGKTAKTEITDGIGNGFSEQKPETFRKLDENHQAISTMETQIGETKERKSTVVKPIVVMIIVGDAIHNFTDGLAIAASFNTSIVEGISTTIAIICHEIPQELGDFAILMKNGLSFKMALLANLFSSLTALLGFYIGVSVSKDAGGDQWIFAIAAGLFLYISLADMIPQLIQSGAGNLRTIVLHNVGILTGILIILILSVFEDRIHI